MKLHSADSILTKAHGKKGSKERIEFEEKALCNYYESLIDTKLLDMKKAVVYFEYLPPLC